MKEKNKTQDDTFNKLFFPEVSVLVCKFLPDMNV